MTEHEAWLLLAERFEGLEAHIGMCNEINHTIHGTGLQNSMRMRLRLFRPHDWLSTWYWPINSERASRTLRATACGFLAAMTGEEVK